MNVRKAIAITAGTVGATTLANRILASRATEFEPFLDGDQGTYRWRGFDVAYAELGDPENDDLVLFHGISAASSNHEFWRIAEQLSEEYHVIAPDLPGFGHSDRPPLLYSSSLYTTFVSDAIEDLTDAPTVVGSSLTGSYVAAAAAETSVDRLILVCPTDTTVGSRTVWMRALFRSPVLGQGLFNLLVSKPALRHFQADHGYYDMDNLPDEVVDYEWQTAHQPGARFAPASFVGGFLDPEHDMTEDLQDVDAPVTLIWGRNAEMLPLSKGREMAEQADAGLVVFDKAKLLPHAEHPEQFVDVLTGEVTAETESEQ
jgi:pimeloyl-ACP methyl ester carboxylesterase